MKKFFTTTIATICIVCSAFAEEGSKAPLALNRFTDNIFVGGAVGINTIADNGSLGRIAPGADVFAGKWLTPYGAIRMGWHGLSNQAVDTANGWFAGEDSFSYNFLHIDWMWDILNQFKYNSERIVSPRLMAQAGCIYTAHNGVSNQEFGFGAAAQIGIRLGKRLEGTVEAALILAREEAYRNAGNLISFPSVTAGVSYKIGKTGFSRNERIVTVTETVTKIVDCGHDALIADLVAQLDSAKKAVVLPAASEPDYITRPAIIYFDLDKDVLTPREKAHLEFLVAHLPEGASLVVTGHADKETGNPKYNLGLSERRAKAIRAELVKLGIGSEKISLDWKGDTRNEYDTKALGTTTNRCCFIQVVLK